MVKRVLLLFFVALSTSSGIVFSMEESACKGCLEWDFDINAQERVDSLLGNIYLMAKRLKVSGPVAQLGSISLKGLDFGKFPNLTELNIENCEDVPEGYLPKCVQ